MATAQKILEANREGGQTRTFVEDLIAQVKTAIDEYAIKGRIARIGIILGAGNPEGARQAWRDLKG